MSRSASYRILITRFRTSRQSRPPGQLIVDLTVRFGNGYWTGGQAPPGVFGPQPMPSPGQLVESSTAMEASLLRRADVRFPPLFPLFNQLEFPV